MPRYRVFALAAALAWAAVPSSAVAEEWEGDRSGPPPLGGSTNGSGEVSVDLEGSTPGLTPELFRSTLASYGDWYVSARYGDVWRPRVAIGWRPYYYGSWQWTNEGWY